MTGDKTLMCLTSSSQVGLTVKLLCTPVTTHLDVCNAWLATVPMRAGGGGGG